MRSCLTTFIFCLATNFAFTEEVSWILFEGPNLTDSDQSKNSPPTNSADDPSIFYSGIINLDVKTSDSKDGIIVYPIEESNYHEIFGERK